MKTCHTRKFVLLRLENGALPSTARLVIEEVGQGSYCMLLMAPISLYLHARIFLFQYEVEYKDLIIRFIMRGDSRLIIKLVN